MRLCAGGVVVEHREHQHTYNKTPSNVDCEAEREISRETDRDRERERGGGSVLNEDLEHERCLDHIPSLPRPLVNDVGAGHVAIPDRFDLQRVREGHGRKASGKGKDTRVTKKVVAYVFFSSPFKNHVMNRKPCKFCSGRR